MSEKTAIDDILRIKRMLKDQWARDRKNALLAGTVFTDTVAQGIRLSGPTARPANYQSDIK